MTLLSVFMAEDGPPIELRRAGREIPVYAFPEDAARALGHAARYGAWRETPPGAVPQLTDIRPDEAAAIIAHALGERSEWLTAVDVARLLDCYGLPAPPARVVEGPVAAERAAGELGGRVALKAIAAGLVHKTEAGAVRVGLRHGEVRRAAARMASEVARAGYPTERFMVQAMAPQGIELLIGVVQDRAFGPLIACGAGGTSAELLGDVAVRLTPLTDLDAAEMLRSLKVFPLLEGYRGAPRCDVRGLEEILLRVSALVEAHPEIAEMDLNPVVATPDGALVVDARIRVAPEIPAPALPSLVS